MLQDNSLSAIGIEASGGYERGVMRALLAAGMSVRQVSPFKLRQFARASGILAKNDPLDACMIASFVATSLLERQAGDAAARPRQTRDEVVANGSPAAANTIGMTDVACLAARTGGVLCVRMTSTLSRTNSAAISAKRSLRPSAQRTSIATLRPSTQPSSRIRCKGGDPLSVSLLQKRSQQEFNGSSMRELAGINLYRTNMRWASLYSADLQGANFEGSEGDIR
jgi:hypothetical protein